ncbi:unnamed protein product, partial [Owenia fusiformis]
KQSGKVVVNRNSPVSCQLSSIGAHIGRKTIVDKKHLFIFASQSKGLIAETRIFVENRPIEKRCCTRMAFDSAAGGSQGVDPEMAQFLQVEAQKAELQQKIGMLTDLCWDKC